MCLLIVARNASADYPLIAIANRDEAYERESEPARWRAVSDDGRELLGGIDQRAGGMWFAATRSGEFAAVTNVRQGLPQGDQSVSRGVLIPMAFSEPKKLEPTLDKTGPCNLILFKNDKLSFYSNRFRNRLDLEHSYLGVSNGDCDEPWPKVRAAKRALKKAIAEGVSEEVLFEILADATIPPDEQLPSTGVPIALERAQAPIFIANEHYGTCASTVYYVSSHGEATFVERRFGPHGKPQGEEQFRWRVGLQP